MNSQMISYKQLIVIVGCFALAAFQSVSAEPFDSECKVFEDWNDGEAKGNFEDEDYQTRLSSSNLNHKFVWENDSFAAGGDRDYTNGMKLAWQHHPCRHTWSDPMLKKIGPSVRFLMIEKIGGTLGLYSPNSNSSFEDNEWHVLTGGAFGMNMYTPSNILKPERLYNDRPYVGWLYGSFVVSSVKKDNESGRVRKPSEDDKKGSLAVSTEIQIGLIGPRAAQGYAQKWIHDEWGMSKKIPQGWSNQVGDRIGIDIVNSVQRNWFSLNNHVRVTGDIGFAVGNVMSYVNGGVIVAVGTPEDEFVFSTIQPAVLFTSMSSPIQQATSTEGVSVTIPNEQRGSFDLFTGLQGRYIFNSIFVEGAGAIQNDIDLVPIVYDAIAGVSWRPYFAPGMKVSYKRIVRSKEFNSPDNSLERVHVLGQFGVDWLF